MHALAIVKAIRALQGSASVRRATVYVGPELTVKATRQRRPAKRSRGETLLVTVGKPNYREREFIKACRKANEPFPVKRVQLQHFPAKRSV